MTTEFDQAKADFYKNFITKILKFKSDTSDAHFNYNTTLVAGVSEEGEVNLYDIENDFALLRSYNNVWDPSATEDTNPLYMTRYVRFSPDNNYLVVCSKLRLVVLKVSDFSEVFVLSDVEMMPHGKDHIRMFTGVSFNESGSILAVATHHNVHLYDAHNRFALVETYDSPPKVICVIFHGDKLIFGSAYDGITLVDRASKKCLATYVFKTKDQDHLRYMDMTPRGAVFLSLYALNPRTLNPDTLEVIHEFDIPYATFFKHRHINDNITVASGGIRGWQQFNHATGKYIEQFTVYEDGYHASSNDCFQRDLSPDNRFIAVCGQDEIRIIYTPQFGVSKMIGTITEETERLVETDPDFKDVQLNEDVLYKMAATLV